jgi:hypothetical protein
MQKFQKEALLQRKQSVFVSPSNGHTSSDVLLALLSEVAQVGYTLSGDVLRVLKTYSATEITSFKDSIIPILNEMVGAHVEYQPLFKNFPKDIPDGSSNYISRLIDIIKNILNLESESFTMLSCGHAINHSLFDLKEYNACPICQHQVNELGNDTVTKMPPLNKISPLTIIYLAKESDIHDIFTNLIGGKTSISESDKSFITEMVTFEGDTIINHVPKVITMKEQLALISGLLVNHTSLSAKTLPPYFKTATDVLRLAVQLSGGDVSLSRKTRFKLSGAQRRAIMMLIEQVKFPLEDMLRHRSAFLSLGKVIHIGQKAKIYPNAAKSFDVLRNDHKSISTFNKKVEALVSNVLGIQQTPVGTAPSPSIKTKLNIVGKKVNKPTPEEVKNLTIASMLTEEQLSALNMLKNQLTPVIESEQREIVIKTDDVIKQKLIINENKSVTPINVVSKEDAIKELLNVLKSRSGEFARRLDFILRNTENSDVVTSAFSDIASELTTPMLLTLNSYFKSRDKKSDFRYFMPKGNVAKIQFLDSDDRNVISKTNIDLICKAIDDALIIRFSELEDLGNVLLSKELERCLVPLSQRNATDALKTLARGSRIKVKSDTDILRFFQYWKGEVDLDLTVTAYDKDWKEIDLVSYYNLTSSLDWGTHSGDILDAPKGAAECVDVDVKKCKTHGIRYLTMFINAFSGQPFSDFDAFAGVMERVDDKTGELFEASTVTNKFNLSGDTNTVIPLIFDLKLMEIIWTDISAGLLNAGSNASTAGKKILNINNVIEQLVDTKPNLFKLFELHAKARAKSLDFERIEGKEYDLVLDINKATDTDDIISNWL